MVTFKARPRAVAYCVYVCPREISTVEGRNTAHVFFFYVATPREVPRFIGFKDRDLDTLELAGYSIILIKCWYLTFVLLVSRATRKNTKEGREGISPYLLR